MYQVNSAVQYSLLVFEIVSYNPCNITGAVYKGLGGSGGQGVGWQAEGGLTLRLGHRQ